jgi:hypothetical protein
VGIGARGISQETSGKLRSRIHWQSQTKVIESSVAPHWPELLGKELGMFVDREPVKPPTLENLSTGDLTRTLEPAAAPPDRLTQKFEVALTNSLGAR